PFHLLGRAPLVPDESALRAEPADVTGDPATRAWLPRLHRARLLSALRRYAEALDTAGEARREAEPVANTALDRPGSRHRARR
ncbi:hypothetical protein, partial [Streptomyces sp. Tu 6176]|uniref:hypothetical protein n=1 Tax=Streptomyces sp. Tu 6176 TaxID=1470557 RepID=UPI00131A0251